MADKHPTDDHLTRAEFHQFTERMEDQFHDIKDSMSKHRDDHARADEREQEAHAVIHGRIDAVKETVSRHEQSTAVEFEKRRSEHNMLALKVGILIGIIITFKDVILDFLTGRFKLPHGP